MPQLIIVTVSFSWSEFWDTFYSNSKVTVDKCTAACCCLEIKFQHVYAVYAVYLLAISIFSKLHVQLGRDMARKKKLIKELEERLDQTESDMEFRDRRAHPARESLDQWQW